MTVRALSPKVYTSIMQYDEAGAGCLWTSDPTKLEPTIAIARIGRGNRLDRF
ncbi:hypothetical protein EYZ11_009543 [Aspergillus tanneri]|uniref:Uncharacterized protein n=1 Tax=Aspergillus tanneri TaxID=1220188 RepID=A0A4V3UNF6_9EURO|nr:hypothetical protein EYZ11_009543 [Aspergillus tanneri]